MFLYEDEKDEIVIQLIVDGEALCIDRLTVLALGYDGLLADLLDSSGGVLPYVLSILPDHYSIITLKAASKVPMNRLSKDQSTMAKTTSRYAPREVLREGPTKQRGNLITIIAKCPTSPGAQYNCIIVVGKSHGEHPEDPGTWGVGSLSSAPEATCSNTAFLTPAQANSSTNDRSWTRAAARRKRKPSPSLLIPTNNCD